MRVGRTLTHHFEIETRQYDLLGIDLGEGARRRMIIFGAVIILIWIALLVPLVGVPKKPTVSLYVVPPFVITASGIAATAAITISTKKIQPTMSYRRPFACSPRMAGSPDTLRIG